MSVYRNFIGGEWVESRSRDEVPNLNPANTSDVKQHNQLAAQINALLARVRETEQFRESREKDLKKLAEIRELR